MFRHRSLLTRVLLCSVLAATFTDARADIPADAVTVGRSSACMAASLQQAVDIAAQIPGHNQIWLTRDAPQGYHLAASAIDVGDESLAIIGGFENCLSETRLGDTLVSGEGGAQDPILRIRGSGSIHLESLALMHGDADALEGGAIDYAGSGTLTLSFMLIENNASVDDDGQGGGIRFRTQGGDAELILDNTIIRNNSADEGGGVYSMSEIPSHRAVVTLLDNVSIENNTARYFGGGILGENNALLRMVGTGSSVCANDGGFQGGGLMLRGASAEISASSVSGRALFDDNLASFGGGIAVVSSFGQPSASLKIFSVAPREAVVLARNRAVTEGGALFTAGNARTCLNNVSLVQNTAPSAAAILHSGVRSGSTTYTGFLHWNGDCELPPEAQVPCRFADGCNRIEGSTAAATEPLVRIVAPARASWNGVHVVYNNAGSAVSMAEQQPILEWRNGLIAENAFMRAPIVGTALDSNALVRISGLTITNNIVPSGTPVFDVGIIRTELTNSIVNQPFMMLGAFVSSAFDRVMARTSDSNLPTGAFVGTPIFEPFIPNPYRQSTNSPGVDAAVCAPDAVDADGRTRNIDIPNVSNGPGVCDLGAFETPGPLQDPVFSEGFE